MKARKVKGLDPRASVADNFERVVRTRTIELLSFMPAAADANNVTVLHDMRIAAKRLRYILEVAHPCFGPYAGAAVKRIKELQDLLGDIHDCDVGAERLQDHLDDLISEDALALALAGEGLEDLRPEALRVARHGKAYGGVAALLVHTRARRRVLFARFERFWIELEREGFAARLEFAIGERPARETDGDSSASGRGVASAGESGSPIGDGGALAADSGSPGDAGDALTGGSGSPEDAGSAVAGDGGSPGDGHGAVAGDGGSPVADGTIRANAEGGAV